jgi:hypothetical protein
MYTIVCIIYYVSHSAQYISSISLLYVRYRLITYLKSLMRCDILYVACYVLYLRYQLIDRTRYILNVIYSMLDVESYRLHQIYPIYTYIYIYIYIRRYVLDASQAMVDVRYARLDIR